MTTNPHPWVEVSSASRVVVEALNELSNVQVAAMLTLVESQSSMLHALIRDNQEKRLFKDRFTL
jgi:hypothetical protein